MKVKVFQTNFLRLAVLLIPTMLRKPAMIAMMRTLITPAILLQNSFNNRREANLYDLAHTGQVCHIKAVLDDCFGFDYLNGFEIEDASNIGEWLMIYDEGSEQNVIIDDEQDHFILNGEATASKDLPVTGDEPGDINEVILIGSREASAFLWNEKMIFVDFRSFIVFVPEEIYKDDLKMPLVKTLVNKYRIVSRSPDYEIKK